MLKYTNTQVTFREIPDEITLCINISGCPIRCPDCHSKELWEDIGTELSFDELKRLIEQNNGITCVCFMGGDSDKWYIRELTQYINNLYPNLKVAWYSGSDESSPVMLSSLDYYKYGSYKKQFGGLDQKTTNQRLFYINRDKEIADDITYKFWKNEDEKEHT